jgi:hypothetical protein
MRNWLACCGIALWMAGASLGAAPRAVAQDDPMTVQLKSGAVMLDCGPPCQSASITQRSQALMLYNSGQWQSLAMLIMQTRYGDDLTWFYLGRAADSLGYYSAAQHYYIMSTTLSASGPACASEVPQAVQAISNLLSGLLTPGSSASNVCNGVALPAQAQMALANVAQEIASQPAPRRRVIRRHVTSHAAAKPAAGIVEAPGGGSGPAPANSSPIVEAK